MGAGRWRSLHVSLSRRRSLATLSSILRLSGKPGNRAGEAKAPRRPRVRSASVLTIDGLLFITLGLLIGLSALNSGQNLLYLVLSMMLSMLIISVILARNNLRRLTPYRNYPLEFYAGQTVQGFIELHNAKRVYYSYAIGVQEVIGGPLRGGKDLETRVFRGFALIVPPGRRAQCPLSINLAVRGLYTIRQARIISRFPFGFFEKMRSYPDAAKILVYPKLVPAYALMAYCPQFFGELEAERKGRGSTIFGIRDYQHGDSARLIHWKLSAKGHGIKAKEFEQEESRSYRLMLDLRCPENPSPAILADFEKAVSVAATLARMMLQQGARVALWTTLGNVPHSTGMRHLQRIMRALAQVEPLTPTARPVTPEAAEKETVEVWLEYLPASGPEAFKPEPAIRRGRNHRSIDVRKIEIPQEPSESVVVRARE